MELPKMSNSHRDVAWGAILSLASSSRNSWLSRGRTISRCAPNPTGGRIDMWFCD